MKKIQLMVKEMKGLCFPGDIDYGKEGVLASKFFKMLIDRDNRIVELDRKIRWLKSELDDIQQLSRCRQ